MVLDFDFLSSNCMYIGTTTRKTLSYICRIKLLSCSFLLTWVCVDQALAICFTQVTSIRGKNVLSNFKKRISVIDLIRIDTLKQLKISFGLIRGAVAKGRWQNYRL
jgi:hypothetical protein